MLGCARYPVILKSVCSRVVIDGESRRFPAVLARSAAERERVLARWLPHTAVQQQEYVTGHGFGIEMLFDRGRLVWHFAHERVHELPLTGGASSYRRSILAPSRMLDGAAHLLSELEWHGVAMVEFRGAGDDWCLMEINPRLWGSLALAIDCGVDFPHGLALLATGQPLPAQPGYNVGYYTRQLLLDLDWQQVNLRANHADPLLLTRPRLSSTLEMLRPLWGAESWDHFDWGDLGLTAALLRTAISCEIRRLMERLGREHARMAVRHRYPRDKTDWFP
jgi:ATP-grasp in the biosynthetic pathway with Ter operon